MIRLRVHLLILHALFVLSISLGLVLIVNVFDPATCRCSRASQGTDSFLSTGIEVTSVLDHWFSHILVGRLDSRVAIRIGIDVLRRARTGGDTIRGAATA